MALLRRWPAISIIILIIIGGTITDIGLDRIALLIGCSRPNGATLSHKAIAIIIIQLLAPTFTASMDLIRHCSVCCYSLISGVCGGLFAKERWPLVEKVITGATFTFVRHGQSCSLCVVHLAISAVFTVRMRLSNDSLRSILVFGFLELRISYECVCSDYTI